MAFISPRCGKRLTGQFYLITLCSSPELSCPAEGGGAHGLRDYLWRASRPAGIRTFAGAPGKDVHARPFAPSLAALTTLLVPAQLREGAALAPLQPVCDSEPVFSLWYCRQRGLGGGGTAAHLLQPLPRVSPAHCATRPFRRTSAFTTPSHLSLHESPVEQPSPPPRLRLLDRLDVQGWRQDGSGPAGPMTPRYPLADVFPDGSKQWCDRHEDPVRVPQARKKTR